MTAHRMAREWKSVAASPEPTFRKPIVLAVKSHGITKMQREMTSGAFAEHPYRDALGNDSQLREFENRECLDADRKDQVHDGAAW